MTVDGCWQGAVFCNAQGGFELTTPTKMKRTAFEWQKKKYAFNRARAADLPHAKETLWHWATEAITKDAIYLNSYTQSEILDEIKIFAMPKENSVSKSRKKNSKFIFFRIWSLDFSSFTSYGFLLPKGRTPNSQKSARISIDLESISDCVVPIPVPHPPKKLRYFRVFSLFNVILCRLPGGARQYPRSGYFLVRI